MKKNSYENILIIKPSAIGDITTALPALRSLRLSLPDAHISWLVRKEFAPLLEGHPFIDKLIIFDRKLLGRWWRSKTAFKALLELHKSLKSGNFDIVIDLQGLFRSGLFAFATGCKTRVGMSNAREGAGIFYTKKVREPDNSKHVIDYYQKIVGEIGATDTSVDFVLPACAEAIQQSIAKLKECGASENNFRIFVAGASEPDKCWQSEKFARLAELITADYGGQIVIVGTKTDTSMAKQIISQSKADIKDLTGKTNLPQLVALMHLSKLVVSNDTGPGHIAIAAKKPAVIIFGYTNPTRLFPYNRRESMVVNDFEGRGEKLRSSNPAHSIKQVSVEQVYKAVVQQSEENAIKV